VISPARQSQFNETNESISDCLQLIRMRSTTKKNMRFMWFHCKVMHFVS